VIKHVQLSEVLQKNLYNSQWGTVQELLFFSLPLLSHLNET
jgi:hypothetical protein